jgi:hypothetical protein
VGKAFGGLGQQAMQHRRMGGARQVGGIGEPIGVEAAGCGCAPASAGSADHGSIRGVGFFAAPEL